MEPRANKSTGSTETLLYHHSQQDTANGKRDEQASSDAGLSKRVITFLSLGVADIAAHDQGFVEEHVFGIFGADSPDLPAAFPAKEMRDLFVTWLLNISPLLRHSLIWRLPLSR